MNKNDKRYLQTELSIRENYIKLLKTRPSHIPTVSELCKAAKINRSSFYLHYKDVNDLHSILEDESFNFINKTFSQYSFNGCFHQLIDHLFENFLEEPLLIDFLLNISTDAKNALITYSKEVTIKEWEKKSSLTVQEAAIVYEYLVGGMIAVLKDWQDHDFQIPEKYKELFFYLSTEGLHHFLYK